MAEKKTKKRAMTFRVHLRVADEIEEVAEDLGMSVSAVKRIVADQALGHVLEVGVRPMIRNYLEEKLGTAKE
jgi:hypothetical protein